MPKYRYDKFILTNSGLPGYITVTGTNLQKLVDGNTSSNGFSISYPDKASFDVDLLNRYELSEVKYFFSGSSTVEFQSSFDGTYWETLQHSNHSGYSSVSGTFGNSAFLWPQKLRIKHEPSSGSSTSFEVEVWTRDGKLLYGYSGLDTSVDIDGNAESEASPIVIRNNSGKERAVYALIDTISSNDYESLSLSSTVSGEYYKKYESGTQQPRDIPFSSGEFSGTTQSGTNVILLQTTTSGYYRSPVYDLYGRNPVRVYWSCYDEAGTSIDSIGNQDVVPTIGVRHHNTSPVSPWVDGSSPDSADPYWGTLSGTLSFRQVVNDSILEVNVGQKRYLQLEAWFKTPASGTSSRLTALGFEEALGIGVIPPGENAVFYAKTSISSHPGSTFSNITTFYYEID